MMEKEPHPLLLAYLGDSVWEVMVREYLIARFSDSASCNRAALDYVTAKSQAAALKRMRPSFTEEEEALFLRARNANAKSASCRADMYSYRLATGLEAVFAWLFLQGKTQRMQELFLIAFPDLHDG